MNEWAITAISLSCSLFTPVTIELFHSRQDFGHVKGGGWEGLQSSRVWILYRWVLIRWLKNNVSHFIFFLESL